MKHNLILNYCCWNQNDHVVRLLKQSDIDVMYKSGVYFTQAIRNNNIDMLNTLLEYYEKTQLRGDPENQYAIPLAKHKLQIILQEAVNTFDISEEMQAVLNQYLPTEEDSDQEQDIEDIVIPFFNKSDEDIKHTELTEDNLKKLSAVENNQIKSIEDLMGFNFETAPDSDHHKNNDQTLDLVGKDNTLDTY